MRKIEIEWEDSESIEGWHKLQDVLDTFEKERLIKSIGYLLKETDNYVIIVQGKQDSGGHVQHSSKIPKGMIKSMKYLILIIVLGLALQTVMLNYVMTESIHMVILEVVSVLDN